MNGHILYSAFVILGAFICALTIFLIRSNGTFCLAIFHPCFTSLIHVLLFWKNNCPSSDRLDCPFSIGFNGSRTIIYSPEDRWSTTGKTRKDGPWWNTSHWGLVKSFSEQKSFPSASLTGTRPQNSLPGSKTIASHSKRCTAEPNPTLPKLSSPHPSWCLLNLTA